MRAETAALWEKQDHLVGDRAPLFTAVSVAVKATAVPAVAEESFDLLVSLYASFISEACTRYLRVGGTLLVNPSHGDAAMASIDPRYELSGVVTSRSGDYRVTTENLDSYLVPKKPVDITPELLHERGRGIAYSKSPFAYLFERAS